MTTTKEDLQFVLAGLDSVERAMQHGNMFAAGVAFAELRQSIRRAIEQTPTAPDAGALDLSTTLDQQEDEKPEPTRDRRRTKRASPGV